MFRKWNILSQQLTRAGELFNMKHQTSTTSWVIWSRTRERLLLFYEDTSLLDFLLKKMTHRYIIQFIIPSGFIWSEYGLTRFLAMTWSQLLMNVVGKYFHIESISLRWIFLLLGTQLLVMGIGFMFL